MANDSDLNKMTKQELADTYGVSQNQTKAEMIAEIQGNEATGQSGAPAPDISEASLNRGDDPAIVPPHSPNTDPETGQPLDSE